MAKLKTVYFCDTDPSKWFENREDAERFDRWNEISSYVKEGCAYNSTQIDLIIERIMERYEITQRWDYKKPEQGPKE